MNIYGNVLIEIAEAVKAYETLNKNVVLGLELTLFEEGEKIATITNAGVELEADYFV